MGGDPPLSHRFRAVWQPGSYDGDERDLMPEGGRGRGGGPRHQTRGVGGTPSPREYPSEKWGPFRARLTLFCLPHQRGEVIIRNNAVIIQEKFSVLRRELMRQ